MLDPSHDGSSKLTACSELSRFGDIERETLQTLHWVNSNQQFEATMDRVQERFNELAVIAERIEQSKKFQDVRKLGLIQTIDAPTNYYTESEPILDGPLLVEWRTSVLSLLSRVFGNDSATYLEFNKASDLSKSENLHSYFSQLKAIFQSAKAEFEGGYLFDVRNLVHASVFKDELDQAKHLLNAGYKVPSAVIAGTVLEMTLREVCSQHSVSASDKLNSMNDELAKAGVYNASRKSQIKAWADIRNSAAHGKPDEFEPGDVSRMIDGIRDFVAIQLG